MVEFFREPDAQIGFIFGTISMGQLLSIPMIVAGGIILAMAYQRKDPLQTNSGSVPLR
jgi:phosphatidylglycerol---prolipoprotein diacylglyceryl transferase